MIPISVSRLLFFENDKRNDKCPSQVDKTILLCLYYNYWAVFHCKIAAVSWEAGSGKVNWNWWDKNTTYYSLGEGNHSVVCVCFFTEDLKLTLADKKKCQAGNPQSSHLLSQPKEGLPWSIRCTAVETANVVTLDSG